MFQPLVAEARNVAVVALGSLSALHLLWSTGNAWPAPDRETLADAIGGLHHVPGTGACLAVATLLGLATVSVAGLAEPLARATRLGSIATSTAFFLRGSIGLAGALPFGRQSKTFVALDRRVYSPICLGIAVISLAGMMPD